MQNPGIPGSPAVHLFYHPGLHDSETLRQISLGLEEQGVPCRTISCADIDNALALAHQAAQHSALRTGIGVSASGDTVLTHAQYPADRPCVTALLTVATPVYVISARMRASW